MLKTFETFYAQKDYANALQTLQKLKSEMGSALWHYNMGVVEAKLENWSEARFHILMAKRHGLNSQEVLQNQDIVEAKLETDRWEKPLGVSDYTIKAGDFVSQGLLTTISLICLVVGLIKLKKNPRPLGVGLFLLAVLFPIGLNFWIKSWPYAVVVAPQTIQEGPSAIFPTKGEMPVGVLVITREMGEWQEVVYPSRFQGWIKKQGLKFLE